MKKVMTNITPSNKMFSNSGYFFNNINFGNLSRKNSGINIEDNNINNNN